MAENRDSIRLEIVRLCHRHDLEPARIIDRATVIERWVVGETETPRPGKKAGADVPAGKSRAVP